MHMWPPNKKNAKWGGGERKKKGVGGLGIPKNRRGGCANRRGWGPNLMYKPSDGGGHLRRGGGKLSVCGELRERGKKKRKKKGGNLNWLKI